MGLLTKEIEVTLNSRNIEHYANLGYEIPKYYNKNSCTWRVKRNTKIIVKIEDVPKFTNYLVGVQCDNENCANVLHMPYQRYNYYLKNGKYYCQKCAMAIYNSGKNNPSWNPNLTDKERITGRHFPEYKDFVKRVLARDHYTCKCCGHSSTNLEVHHLNGYNWFPEGRTDETNAITLCENCHSSFHSIYGQGNNTKEQFEEWIGKPIEFLDKFDGMLPIGRNVICYETLETYNSPADVENKTGILSQRIINCCNKRDYTINGHRSRAITANGNHYFWLDEYKNMSQEDFDNYFEWCKPIKIKRSGKDLYNSKKVICLTTLEIFDSMSDAARKYENAHMANISRCCKGITKTCGKLPDGTKLKWMYYEDYLISTASLEVGA